MTIKVKRHRSNLEFGVLMPTLSERFSENFLSIAGGGGQWLKKQSRRLEENCDILESVLSTLGEDQMGQTWVSWCCGRPVEAGNIFN